MPKLEIKGLDKLEKALKKNVTMNDVKKVVRHNGAQLHQQAQTNADFRGHMGWKKGVGYTFVSPTGTLKRGIDGPEMKDGGFTAEVEATVHYSPYLEYGTRFMEPQPYMKPAYNSQKIKFKRDMDKLVR